VFAFMSFTLNSSLYAWLYCNKQKSGNFLCMPSFVMSFSFNIKQWASYIKTHWPHCIWCELDLTPFLLFWLFFCQIGSTTRTTDTNDTILKDNHQWWSHQHRMMQQPLAFPQQRPSSCPSIIASYHTRWTNWTPPPHSQPLLHAVTQ